jgi:hypothetical protein
MAYDIKSWLVKNETVLKLALAPGGGAAVSIRPATAEEVKKGTAYQGK